MAATVKKEEEKTREEQTQEEKLSGIASIMGKNQYTPGDTVQQAQQRLNAKREDKPGQYSCRWQEQMDGILQNILNRKEFRYDVNADPLFQQYRDQYTRAGQTAMQDTMGKAAQLTGGYGNSYAQQAGQQTYNTYMQGLTDKIPELYSLALQAYNNQGNDLKDRYSLLGTADDQDYGRYRDSVSDYNTELDRLTNEYNTERSYDYGQYRDNMTDAQQRWTNAWTLYQKGGKALLNWCQNMDVFATSTMYAMAEEAVKSRGMKSGDGGFEKAVNEMYTDIIRKTQPNYTITERSEMLRDSRAGAKIFSMYKTQPNQNLNILMQAAGTLSKVSRDFKAGVGGVTAADVRRAKTDFVNAGTAVVVGGNLMFVLVRTGVNLIMGQVAGYRDDETNEVTSDAVLEGMFKEFLSSMSGMFLLGGQAYDILNSTVSGESYYGLSDNAIKTVGDLTEKSVKLFQKIKEGGVEFGDYEKTAGALLTAMGVPYSNAKRFVEAYRHWAQNLEKGSLWNYSEEYTTGANYRNRFLEAYRAGDQEGCGNSLAALAALSDAPNQRRIASEVRSGFQSSFREKFLQGEITADEV